MMQDILKRLEQTRNELTQIIEQVPVHLFNLPEREGAWSIGQVCQHLVMTELLFTKAIKQGLAADDLNAPSRRIDLLANEKRKFESPDFAKPQKDEVLTYEIMNKKLTETRRSLLNVIEGEEDLTIFNRKAAKHPFFEELSLKQWIELLYIHEARHISQILRIKRLLES
ncbi:DinB family protein [Paenibacillus sp. AN1007]|uniref:DinB family protein n=2 Tax=unclassified Paenibacillus TaxID=185978 RepID=A0AAU8NLA6_9BACL